MLNKKYKNNDGNYNDINTMKTKPLARRGQSQNKIDLLIYVQNRSVKEIGGESELTVDPSVESYCK